MEISSYLKLRVGLVLALQFVFLASGHAQSKPRELLAQDINGYALDMTVAQIQAVAGKPLEPLGGNQYKVTANGIDYDFGFSVLGHLFRIDSDQELGHFIPDKIYAKSLTDRMSAKFGPPADNELPSGPLSWGFTQRIRSEDGVVMDMQTVSLSALLTGGYGQPINLHLKLMDFRIMRRDLAKANAAPRSRAEGKTKF